MNTEAMESYESMVADYVESTANHALHRATPVFGGENLVCSGVLLEAESVEDVGEGIWFCVWCYNVQPGVSIDYATGDSRLAEDTLAQAGTDSSETANDSSLQTAEAANSPAISNETSTDSTASETTYILNTNTKKFHLPGCSSVNKMKDKNKKEYTGTREDVIAQGYDPCARCNP